jgi:hypothetical protein
MPRRKMQVGTMVHEDRPDFGEIGGGLDGWSEAVRVMLDRSSDEGGSLHENLMRYVAFRLLIVCCM